MRRKAEDTGGETEIEKTRKGTEGGRYKEERLK
jgi:hypothetical protein